VFRMSEVRLAAVRDGMSSTYLRGEKYVAAGLGGAGTDAGDTAPLFVGYSDDNLRWAFDTHFRTRAACRDHRHTAARIPAG